MTINGSSYTLDAESDDGSSAMFIVGECSSVTLGCMDDTACNYNMDANTDDGSCVFAATGFDCDGNCLSGSVYDVVVGGGSWDSGFMEHY